MRRESSRDRCSAQKHCLFPPSPETEIENELQISNGVLHERFLRKNQDGIYIFIYIAIEYYLREIFFKKEKMNLSSKLVSGEGRRNSEGEKVSRPWTDAEISIISPVLKKQTASIFNLTIFVLDRLQLLLYHRQSLRLRFSRLCLAQNTSTKTNSPQTITFAHPNMP